MFWYGILSHCRAMRVCQKASVSQAVSQLVENSVKFFLKFRSNFFESVLGRSESMFGLANVSSRKILNNFKWIYFMVRPHNLLWTTNVVHDMHFSTVFKSKKVQSIIFNALTTGHCSSIGYVHCKIPLIWGAKVVITYLYALLIYRNSGSH